MGGTLKEGDLLYQFVFDRGSITRHVCEVDRIFYGRRYDQEQGKYADDHDKVTARYRRTDPGRESYRYHVLENDVGERVSNTGGMQQFVVLEEDDISKAADILHSYFVERRRYHDSLAASFARKAREVEDCMKAIAGSDGEPTDDGAEQVTLYICDGQQPGCPKHECYLEGGECWHTADKAHSLSEKVGQDRFPTRFVKERFWTTETALAADIMKAAEHLDFRTGKAVETIFSDGPGKTVL